MNITTKILGKMFSLLPLLTLINLSCNKGQIRPCISGVAFSFSSTAIFSPEQSVFSVGDTIFLTSEIPKMLQDNINSANTIDYSGSAGISGNLLTAKFDTVRREVLDSYSSFTINALLGSSIPIIDKPNKGVSFFYQENTLYQLKLGIVLKERGIFILGLSDCLSAGLPGKRCSSAAFSMKVTNAEKNFGFYEYALGRPADSFAQDRGFCFRVI